MTQYMKSISAGNLITIAVVIGGFAVQWGAFSSQLSQHDKEIKQMRENLLVIGGRMDGVVLTAHQEQRATDAKLSEIGLRTARIEEAMVYVKSSLSRIENKP